MKDKIWYREAFKLKVMKELRDAKWKTVKEAATAYGIAEMSVYNHRRFHESLDYKTPVAFRAEWKKVA